MDVMFLPLTRQGILFIYFLFFKDFIYLLMRNTHTHTHKHTHTHTQAETQAEEEAGSMQGARHGTRPWVSRITPAGLKAGAKPSSHPGIPMKSFYFNPSSKSTEIGTAP